jgi:hypothetical protein
LIVIFSLLTQQATLMRRSTVLNLPLQLVFPGWTNLNVMNAVNEEIVFAVKSGIHVKRNSGCQG